MRYFFHREKAIDKLLMPFFGDMVAQLDLNGLADDLLGVTTVKGRDGAIYSKVHEGHITVAQLIESLQRNKTS